MKKTFIAASIAALLLPLSASADESLSKHSIWVQKVLWEESQGRFEDNAVILAPEKACDGDLMVDLVNVSLPNVQGTWEIDARAEMASNMKAFIIKLEASHVYEGKFPPLSVDVKPTTEVVVACREPAKLSVKADENGELLFIAHSKDIIEALDRASVNYIMDIK